MAYLEVLDGRFRGRRIPLRVGDFLVGREKGKNHLVLDDEVVSRRHVRFQTLGEKTVVEDLESNNGTFVNGGRISGAVELSPGDEVGIGAAHFRFRAGSGDGEGLPVPAAAGAAPEAVTAPQPLLSPADRPPPDTVRRLPEKKEEAPPPIQKGAAPPPAARPAAPAKPSGPAAAPPGPAAPAKPSPPAAARPGPAAPREAKVKEWLSKIEAERREKERSAGLLSEDLAQRTGFFRLLVYLALAGGGLALAGLVYYLVLLVMGDV